MKFSLVAIFAAFLCAAVVSAAPSQDNSFTTFDGDSLPDKIKCIRGIFEAEVGDQLKDFWETKKSEFQDIMSEWKKCSEAGKPMDQFKCRLEVAKKIQPLVKEVIDEFCKVLSPEKIKEIREKIKEKCLKGTFDISNDFEELALPEDASLPEQFQCIADVTGDVSGKNGFSDLWSRTQPQLQMHIDQWKGCANVENKWLRRLCNVKEGFQTIQTFQEYFKLVAEQNPQVLIQILRQIQTECSAPESIQEMLLQ